MPHVPDILKSLFSESAYTLVLENQNNNPHYQAIQKEYSALFDAIQDLLGKKNRKMMLNLEAMYNEMKSMDDEILYLQGMIDCADLLRMISLI